MLVLGWDVEEAKPYLNLGAVPTIPPEPSHNPIPHAASPCCSSAKCHQLRGGFLPPQSQPVPDVT